MGPCTANAERLRVVCASYHTSDMAGTVMTLLGRSQMTTRAFVLLVERRDTVSDVVSVRIESQLLCRRRPTVWQRFCCELLRYDLQQQVNHLKGGKRLDESERERESSRALGKAVWSTQSALLT